MKAFHTISIPHKDILEGRLTMDVFAADLERVCRNEGPDEYRDAETFFEKTYVYYRWPSEPPRSGRETAEGKGRRTRHPDPDPFGGGNTHALIVMYHRAREWKA